MVKERIQNGDAVTLKLEGRLDTVTAPALQEELMPEFDSAKEVTLDFAELVYVSSAGLRVLLMGEKTAKAKSAKMILINVSDEIMEVLNMTGFNTILTVQ